MICSMSRTVTAGTGLGWRIDWVADLDPDLMATVFLWMIDCAADSDPNSSLNSRRTGFHMDHRLGLARALAVEMKAAAAGGAQGH